MCWYCGEPVLDETIGRSLRCPTCGKDLRVCRHCKLYLAGARYDCAEAKADVPSDKEIANFCDWFSLDPKFRSATAGQKKAADKAKSAKSMFEDMFK